MVLIAREKLQNVAEMLFGLSGSAMFFLVVLVGVALATGVKRADDLSATEVELARLAGEVTQLKAQVEALTNTLTSRGHQIDEINGGCGFDSVSVSVSVCLSLSLSLSLSLCPPKGKN